MKLGFLELPLDERRLYLEQATIQRNVSAVMLEKDFWVCWLLGVLFDSGRPGVPRTRDFRRDSVRREIPLI